MTNRGPEAVAPAWHLADPHPAAPDLATALGLAPAAAQVLARRGVIEPVEARAFLEAKLAALTPPGAMADRAAAAERLVAAIRGRERIGIYGDYDVDGVTSAAILTWGLGTLGGDVFVHVSDRFAGGYGLSAGAARALREAGARVIVTCDCGSSDHDAIAECGASGVDVIVVDHHRVPEEKLPALAFLNPHRPDCGFPFKDLCSAGLAFSLLAAVRQPIRPDLDLRQVLDLVALGTIADVVPLRGDNRALVRAGLRRMGPTGARLGLSALCREARIQTHATSADVSFRLGPRLNAAGRLGDARLALDLLLATSDDDAALRAAELTRLSDLRRTIEAQVLVEAQAQLAGAPALAGAAVVCVGAEGWHPGVVGIVAARLAEATSKSAVVVGFDGALGRGSVRRAAGQPIFDWISACREHLEAFGGHAAAAGLTVRRDRFDSFRDALLARAGAAQGPPAPEPITLDAALFAPDVSPVLLSDLARIAPFGEGHEEPIFLVRGVEVAESRAVGDVHLRLRVRPPGGRFVTAFGFRLASRAPEAGSRVDLAASLRTSTSGPELYVRDLRRA